MPILAMITCNIQWLVISDSAVNHRWVTDRNGHICCWCNNNIDKAKKKLGSLYNWDYVCIFIFISYLSRCLPVHQLILLTTAAPVCVCVRVWLSVGMFVCVRVCMYPSVSLSVCVCVGVLVCVQMFCMSVHLHGLYVDVCVSMCLSEHLLNCIYKPLYMQLRCK